jgi:hypothetical protein
VNQQGLDAARVADTDVNLQFGFADQLSDNLSPDLGRNDLFLWSAD